MNPFERQLLRDYGHDVWTAAGVRAFERRLSTAPVTVGRYVRWVRQLNPAGCDSRLIAVGHNRLPPRKFADILPAWLEYWRAAAARPDVVGSDYNPGVDAAWRAFRSGIPAQLWKRSGHAFCRRSRMIALARCRRRTSFRAYHDWELGRDAKRALGRLCPELQRVALLALPLVEPAGSCVRSRELPWELIAQYQERFRRSALARYEITKGKRQEQLAKAALKELNGALEASGRKRRNDSSSKTGQGSIRGSRSTESWSLGFLDVGGG